MQKSTKAKLTKKQKDFAEAYLETGIGNLAVKQAKYKVSTDESARAIASQNLTKPSIQAYLEDRAEEAAIRVVELSKQGENLPVALNASKDILDRAGYKPIERSVNVSMQVNIENRQYIETVASKVIDDMKNGEDNA